VAGLPLEQILGAGDAHAILAELVVRSHQREAASQAALLALGGDEAEIALRLAAWDHGVELGRRIADERGLADLAPADAFDVASSVTLEDLPCRTAATVLEEDASRIGWKHDRCPYRAAWQSAGLAHAAGCNVVSAWTRGLVHGLAPTLEYRRPRAIAAGDTRCEHLIVVLR
jgi:hypothetical protein